MTALENAGVFLDELYKRHVPYQLLIVRPDALMVSIAIPGENWEVEFFDSGRIDLERFVSRGVEDRDFTVAEVLEYFDRRFSGELGPEDQAPSHGMPPHGMPPQPPWPPA